MLQTFSDVRKMLSMRFTTHGCFLFCWALNITHIPGRFILLLHRDSALLLYCKTHTINHKAKLSGEFSSLNRFGTFACSISVR